MRLAQVARNILPRQSFTRTASLRSISTHATNTRFSNHTSRLSRIGLATGSVIAVSILLGNTGASDRTIHADADVTSHSERPPTPLSTLIRSYVVYSFCSVPAIVDWSPTILSTLTSIPGLKQITEALVRITFFDHFVGGDTAQDAIPLIEQLRNENKGCLFAYSVEVDEHEAAGHERPDSHSRPKPLVNKQIVEETIHCIDVAADFEDKRNHGKVTGRRTWVALKLSALVPDANSLLHFSKYLVATRPAPSTPIPFPGRAFPSDLDVLSSTGAKGPLSDTDISALRELETALVRICTRAQERGIRIIVDAEHSWYQPAIDAFTLSLMREFNKLPEQPRKWSWSLTSTPHPQTQPTVQPLIYGTFQAYLRRTPEHIAQSLEQARKEGFALGVKLVRGAYHPHELAAHKSGITISPEGYPPVHLTKTDTDACYNACASRLISNIREDIAANGQSVHVGVLLGTHNWESCDLVLKELVRQGLATSEKTPRGGEPVIKIGDEVNERITLGQLYGMSDALTNSLVDRTRTSSPFVLKYIPYGSLEEVMPYLSRRAVENKSVLGNGAAADERRRAASEIWARIFG